MQREEFYYPAETTRQKRSAEERMKLDKETKRAIIHCVLGLGKGLKYTQAATRRNGRVIHQDQILETVIEYIEDHQQAEIERIRMEAFRQLQSYRRTVEALRRTA